ncbi:MAG: PepSY domain-containing protein [Steroidobacteraceae bacterium]
MKAILFRTLVFTHRYIGIAIGWLMLCWCLSGLVMLYITYPELHESERLAALDTLEMSTCCNIPADLLDEDRAVSAVVVEMFNQQPVLRVQPDVGPTELVNLRTGERVELIDEAAALNVARRYQINTGLRGEPRVRDLIEESDQWTVYPRYGDYLPLYHIDLNDAAGTEVYVSSVTGTVVQKTQRMQRFWNWLGSVPHWLYFKAIRQDGALWFQVVVWASSIGTFLTVFGLYLGVWQLRRKSDNKLHSPYRGWKYWHHVPGLLFGVMVLTWVFSGLLSMTPFSWLESAGSVQQARTLRGDLPDWKTMRQSLLQMGDATLPIATVQVASAMFDGRLRYVTETRNGARTRLDDRWQIAPLSQLEQDRIGALLGGLHVDLMTQEDTYYYAQTGKPIILPVLRALSDNQSSDERYYLDATTGALLSRVDAGAYWYRWLHTGLHRLDFHALLRMRPLRDILMWTLLLGASTVCLTGVWLGVRRLRGIK